jgi:hypothetical protein
MKIFPSSSWSLKCLEANQKERQEVEFDFQPLYSNDFLTTLQLEENCQDIHSLPQRKCMNKLMQIHTVDFVAT